MTHFALIQALHGEALVTDPTWIFLLVLVIILCAPLLLRKLHIPHIIGLILAGVLVGEYGLNLLERDSSFQLFGQVGIYYIMFLAGLELNMGSVARYATKGLQFGLLTFFVPFVIGFFSVRYFLDCNPITALMLSCIFSSHTLVSYPIVGRYGMSGHRSVVISVVATAIATFASLLTLALVLGSQDSEAGWLHWVKFTGGCIIYGGIVYHLLPRLGRWFLRRYDDRVMQYIFVLSLMFLSAVMAKSVGLEGLLGAFLAGLVANRLIPRTSPLMSRIEFVGNALFIPYFLIGVGMIIDVSVLVSDSYVLKVVLVMVLTATLTKWIAAWLMNRISHGNKASQMLMFGLTNAHAAGALAIVMIGTKAGLMDDSVLNGTVMLILFSCIVSSFATNNGARRLALSNTELEENRGAYHGKCLISFSQPQSVDFMTQLAILIRNPYIHDSLMGLSVCFDEEGGTKARKTGESLLREAQNIAAEADVHMAVMSRVSTNIASGILHTMRENEAGEVIVSLEDRVTGMPKSSLGYVIDNVLAGTHRELIAIRCIVPPGTLNQVIVVVPRRAEYEVGFYKWLEHVCRMGEQLDCRLRFHAHAETMPHIQDYLREKHGNIRVEYVEMPHWGSFLTLAEQIGEDQLLVVVTSRPGFISYAPPLRTLPQQIATHFKHTSVMLLYPDQWGEPSEAISIFAPNGQSVTKRVSWFEQFIQHK